MYPCELMPSAGTGSWPARRAASRWISTSGAKRSGMPPMIASAIGRPSTPAPTADRRVARGRGAEHNRGGGDDEVGAMVLADGEDVEADLLGEIDLFQQVLHALLRADHRAGDRIGLQLRERVEAEFHDRVLGWSSH